MAIHEAPLVRREAVAEGTMAFYFSKPSRFRHPGHITGDILGKALAVQGKAARLRFLNRGQQWVARKIGEALPRVEQGVVRGALFAMQESHLLNIEACDALIEILETCRKPS